MRFGSQTVVGWNRLSSNQIVSGESFGRFKRRLGKSMVEDDGVENSYRSDGFLQLLFTSYIILFLCTIDNTNNDEDDDNNDNNSNNHAPATTKH